MKALQYQRKKGRGETACGGDVRRKGDGAKRGSKKKKKKEENSQPWKGG